MKHIVIALAIIIICSILFWGCDNIQNPNDRNKPGIGPENPSGTGINTQNNGSSRFIDNGDRSISDLQLGVVWLKCAVGSKDKDCCDLEAAAPDCMERIQSEHATFVPDRTDFIPGATCESPTNCMCISDDSAEARCMNGVLCGDGRFIVIDWKTDWQAHPDNWKPENMPSNAVIPTVDDLTGCQYFAVPYKSKEMACKSHDGVSLNSWRVPTLFEISSLYNASFHTGIDARFFPHTIGAYISIDANDVDMLASESQKAEARKAVHFPDGRTGDESTAHVRCVSDQSNTRVAQTTGAAQNNCASSLHSKGNTIVHGQYDENTKSCTVAANSQGQSYSYEMWSKETSTGHEMMSKTTDGIITMLFENRNTGDQISYDKSPQSAKFIKFSNKINAEVVAIHNEFEKYLQELRNNDCSCKPDDSLYSGKKDNINGLECYYLKNPIRINFQQPYTSQEISTSVQTSVVYDCINREFCEPLISKTYQNNCLETETRLTPLSRDVADSLFTPPTDVITSDEYFKQVQQGGAPVSNNDGQDSKSDDCLQKCQDMQTKCQAQGQIVNSDASGCYTPSSDPNAGYQRSCEYSCLSV